MAKPPVAPRNLSPHGWWVGTYIERFELNGEDRTNPNRRCHAYENTVLIQAKTRDEAYAKLIAIGRSKSRCTESGPPGMAAHSGKWCFDGVVDLLPVYDALEDGAELIWHHHRNVAVKTVQSQVRRKRDLPVFDDADRS